MQFDKLVQFEPLQLFVEELRVIKDLHVMQLELLQEAQPSPNASSQLLQPLIVLVPWT